MTDKELMDLAMQVATGNLTTATVGYDEFQSEDFVITDNAWQPFEYYEEGEYADMIMVEYDTVLRALKKVRGPYKSIWKERK